jgi:hypothetical protein
MRIVRLMTVISDMRYFMSGNRDCDVMLGCAVLCVCFTGELCHCYGAQNTSVRMSDLEATTKMFVGFL